MRRLERVASTLTLAAVITSTAGSSVAIIRIKWDFLRHRPWTIS